MTENDNERRADDDSDTAALLPDADPGQTEAEKLSKDEGRTEEDREP